jgi:hypothetical protein
VVGWLLLVLCLLVLPGRALALPEDTWVVAIANNSGDPDEVQLLYAERDAQELVAVLRTQGGVASDRVRLLINEDVATVRRTLLSINAALRENRQGTLVVFYSGHADADALHLRGSRLPVSELRGLVESSPAAMRLLVVDACRSGSVTRVKGVRAAPEFVIRLDNRVSAEGLAIISSSAAGESSQESDRLRGSFFSHHLVNALRGVADRDGDNRVTLSEAYAYAYTETLRSSGNTLSLQHPTYAFDVKGSGDLVLTSVTDASRGAARLRLSDAGLYLITEDREDGPVVAEVKARRAGAFLSIPRGHYFVQQRGADEYREYQVVLLAGQTVDLSRLVYRSVRYDRLVRKRGGAHRSRHGVSLLLCARGEVIAGEGPTLHPVLGYQEDLPFLTLSVRLSGSTVRSVSVDGGLGRRHDEVAAQVLVQRFIDLPVWSLSLAFGLNIEGSFQQQTFDSGPRSVPARHALGLGFGGLLALERPLWRGLGVRVEGGPMTLLLPQAVIQNGVQVGATLASPFTFWAGGGLLWRI